MDERNATLTRTETGDEGTFGCLVTDLGHVCFTAELPWRDNATGISCIPPGRYSCSWRFSPAHDRDCYHVDGVPDRTDVEIHSANLSGDVTKMNPSTGKPFESQLKGCIAPGVTIGQFHRQKAVISSQLALLALEDNLERKPFWLTIVGIPSGKRS